MCIGNIFLILYIGNIPSNRNESQLLEVFETYGEVDTIKIVNHASRRFAFVTYNTIEQAMKVKQSMHKSLPWKSTVSFAHHESFIPPQHSSRRTNSDLESSNINTNTINYSHNSAFTLPPAININTTTTSRYGGYSTSGGSNTHLPVLLSPSSEGSSNTFLSNTTKSSISSIGGHDQNALYRPQPSPYSLSQGLSHTLSLPGSYNTPSQHQQQQSYSRPVSPRSPIYTEVYPNNNNSAYQILAATNYPTSPLPHHSLPHAQSHTQSQSQAASIQAKLGQDPVLRYLCDDRYPATQHWPSDEHLDYPYITKLVNILTIYQGRLYIREIMNILHIQLFLSHTQQVSWHALKSFLAAYPAVFLVQGLYSIVQYYT